MRHDPSEQAGAVKGSAAGREKKKVLMLASVASMIGQFNMPNIRLLLEMGFELHVACNFRTGNTCNARQLQKLRKTLGRMGVVCHQWDCPRNVSELRKCIAAYRQLWTLTGRYRFAWMHCHSPVGGALARIAAHWRGIGVIYTAHGFHFYRGAPLKNWLLYYPAELLLSYWTDLLVTVNREDYRFAQKRLRAGQVVYIPGIGIDTEKYGEPDRTDRDMFRRRFHIPKDAKVLLSVGELSRRKNHQAVLTAMAMLGRQDLYYLICGQGSERKNLRKYADCQGIGTYLRMPGYQENMTWIYQNADLFVFPSVQEGMPVALMEAMAAGLPCVVSDIRGNRELICGYPAGCLQDGGVRFSPESTEQLLSALNRLLENPKLRQSCGDRNREKIKNYSEAAVQKRMRKIYRTMDWIMDQGVER